MLGILLVHVQSERVESREPLANLGKNGTNLRGQGRGQPRTLCCLEIGKDSYQLGPELRPGCPSDLVHAMGEDRCTLVESCVPQFMVLGQVQRTSEEKGAARGEKSSIK